MKISKFKSLLVIIIFLLLLIILDISYNLSFRTIDSLEVQNVSMDLVNYFPLAILSYFFFSEIFQILNKNNYLIKFSLKGEGIVLIQNFNLWLAIFETYSINEIQKKELKQLKYLERFSLEFDIENSSLRIFIFSRTYKNLLKLIEESKPIIETVLPNTTLLTNDKIKKILENNKLLRFHQNYVLKEESKILLPQSTYSNLSSSSLSKLIITYNIPRDNKKTNSDDMNYTQCYFFYSWDEKSFFNFLSEVFFSYQNLENKRIWNIESLQRARLRFQIRNIPLISFQESIDELSRIFSKISSEKSSGKDITDVLLSSLDTTRLETTSTKKLESMDIPSICAVNQVCFELCNISNDLKLTAEEKIKQCYRRSKFCSNLLTSKNFSTILDKTINQENSIEKIHLISELKNHLSYNQLVCIFAHATQLMNRGISFQRILSIIQILFELEYKFYKRKNSDKLMTSAEFIHQNSLEQTSSL